VVVGGVEGKPHFPFLSNFRDRGLTPHICRVAKWVPKLSLLVSGHWGFVPFEFCGQGVQ
jgi:hypothetical protein